MAIRAFNTPANERSFSSLIDQVVLETGKTGSLRSIVGFANLTIRECQALGLFSGDLREEEVTATANPHIYVKPRFFRSIRAVRYATCGDYPKAKLPGRAQEHQRSFFYAVDDSYVFKGPTVGEIIQLANYYWATPLVYFGILGLSTVSFPGGPYAIRPAYYDLIELGWKYLNLGQTAYVDTLGDTVEEALRRLTAENWLVANWWDVLVEGTKAKVHKQFGDDRAALHFANYKQGQLILRSSTGFEAEVGAMVGSDG